MCPANTCGIFLFTLPVRAATSCGDYSHNFYSRHPYGRRPPAAIIRTLFLFTPPTRAATTKNKNKVLRRREKYLPWASQFLFTPPMRAATLHLCGSQFPTISIHATRTGSDERKDMPVSRRRVFLRSEHLRSAQDPIRLYRNNVINAVQYVLLYASCTGRQLCLQLRNKKASPF